LDPGHLRGFLDRRVRDGVVRRAIGKWLKAGALKEGVLRRRRRGTPQGGVISPLLANVYLHEVLDRWFTEQVVPRMRGPAFLLRYADDVLMVFAREEDARRVVEVLPKRLGRFGLRLHPDKTRLVPFHPPRPRDPAGGRRGSRPGSFDFLGFTHLWAKSRKGRFVIQRKTASKSLRRSRRALNQWLRFHRHLPIEEQHRMLSLKLRGHFAYFGITGNSRSLALFRWTAIRLWNKWLNRRSQPRTMPWTRFALLLRRYPVPRAVAIHSLYRRAANP
jgi:hypothetical protein